MTSSDSEFLRSFIAFLAAINLFLASSRALAAALELLLGVAFTLGLEAIE